MARAFEGSNYQKTKLYDSKEIAKIIREKLKKEFPICKFSVRVEHHRAIHVNLMEAPFVAIEFERRYIDYSNEIEKVPCSKQHAQLNQYTFKDENFEEYQSNGAYLSKECWEVMKKVCEIASSWNYDDSDPMTDYCAVNFFFYPSIGKWDKEFINTSIYKAVV